MKVAIIINTSWNIYNFRRGLIQYFISRGDQVVAIAPFDDYSRRLEDIGCTYEPITIRGTGMNPSDDIRFFFRLKKLIGKHKPDVVLTYTIKPNIYGSMASWLLGIPCICNVSGLGTVFLWKGILRNFATSLYSFAFRFNKWVFFQNDEDRRDFLQLVKLSPDKTSLLPGSGIDINAFKYSPSTNQQKTVFLMISRLIIEKGVREYIDAIRLIKNEVRNVEFRLVGSLDQEHARSISQEELDSWIGEDLIDYRGQVDDIRPVIETADVVVLPSYREGTPRTLLEGGAMGKALLASDVPGCRHLIHSGKNGFLFEVRNPKDLANKMKLYLALSISEREVISMNSRKMIEEGFDEKKVIELYIDKIHELLSKKQESLR